MQSNLSDLSLFLANESKKLYILVDNRPWSRDLGSRRAQLWQLMVTKVVKSTFLHLNYMLHVLNLENEVDFCFLFLTSVEIISFCKH